MVQEQGIGHAMRNMELAAQRVGQCMHCSGVHRPQAQASIQAGRAPYRFAPRRRTRFAQH